ncbi:MAG: hypothetical protein H7330_08360 [Hymenobacteraceae bacterium]|nr:hypothetical protein [Hymenobacteraceae bacterium]
MLLLPMKTYGLFLVSLLVLLLSNLLGWAQTADGPPPSGYTIREVEHLQPAPAPPGGLVPFARGKLWGLCDTLGRIWIKPVFANPPSFLVDGIGQVQTGAVSYYADPPPDQGARGAFLISFFNARGEVLRPSISRDRLAVRHADGSLHLVKRRKVTYNWAFTGFQLDRASQRLVPAKRWVFPKRYVDGYPLGGGMSIVFRNPLGGWTRTEYNSGAARRGALVDARGRRLTRFVYQDIEPFQGNLARYRLTGYGSRNDFTGGWGLVDKQGKEVLGHAFGSAAAPCCGMAAVSGRQRKASEPVFSALVDSVGRALGTWTHDWIGWLIPGAVLEGRSVSGRNLIHVFYDPRDGQTLLGGRSYREAYYLGNQAAAVRDSAGPWGLLGADRRWLAPCDYEQMKFVTQYDDSCRWCGEAYRASEEPNEAVAVQRGAKWGLLRVRDGQELAPLRYEEMLVTYQQGWSYAVRDGLPYVLYKGREVIQAQLDIHPSFKVTEYRRLVFENEQPRGYLTVRSGTRLAVIDSSGKFVCPWYEAGDSRNAPRYLPESGLTVAPRQHIATNSGDWPEYALLDGQGKEVVAFHPHCYQVKYLDGLVQLQRNVFTANGQQLVVNQDVELLSGGWALARHPSLLVSRDGKRYEAPPGQEWSLGLDDYSSKIPFTYNVVFISRQPTATQAGGRGFMLRSGKIFWFDEIK